MNFTIHKRRATFCFAPALKSSNRVITIKQLAFSPLFKVHTLIDIIKIKIFFQINQLERIESKKGKIIVLQVCFCVFV